VKKPPAEQLGFDLEAEEPSRKRGGRRRRASSAKGPSLRRGTKEAPLLTAPVVRRCGLCGAEITILGQAAICPDCGGIVGRQMDPDTE